MNIEEAFLKLQKQDIGFETTLKTKNEKFIERRNEELVKLTVKLVDGDVLPHLYNTLNEKMNKIAYEIKEYTEKVKEQEEYIAILKSLSIYKDFSKEDMLFDRIQTRDLFRGIIKKITVDNTDINIEL